MLPFRSIVFVYVRVSLLECHWIRQQSIGKAQTDYSFLRRIMLTLICLRNKRGIKTIKKREKNKEEKRWIHFPKML